MALTLLYKRPVAPTGTVITLNPIGQGLSCRQFGGSFEVYPQKCWPVQLMVKKRMDALWMWHKLVEKCADGEPNILHLALRRYISSFLESYGRGGRLHPPYGFEPVPVPTPFNGEPLHPLNFLLDPQAYVMCSNIRDAYETATAESFGAAPLVYTDDEEQNAKAKAYSDAQDKLMAYISEFVIPYRNAHSASMHKSTPIRRKLKNPPTSPHDDTMRDIEVELTLPVDGMHDPNPYYDFLSEVKTVAIYNGAAWKDYEPTPQPMGRPPKGSVPLKEKIRILYRNVRNHGITAGNAQHTYNTAADLYQQMVPVMMKWRKKQNSPSSGPRNRVRVTYQQLAAMEFNLEHDK